MTKKIILHSTFAQGDGVGDFVYLRHHLKTFTRQYTGDAEHRVLILAMNPVKIAKSLKSLQKAEPNHPIFNFFAVVEKKIVAKVSPSGANLGFFGSHPGLFGAIDLKTFFPDIANTHVMQIKVSSPISMCYKDLNKNKSVDHEFGIFEFDGWPVQKKNPTYSALGLGANDFGLLHDIDGITGSEDLDSCIEQLPPDLKQLVFQNNNISIAAARAHLATTPTALIYCSGLGDTSILSVILKSPIMQSAIKTGKQPLFFITGTPVMGLPTTVQAALKAGQIRVINQWLPDPDYDKLTAVLMNKDVSSLVSPGGDNSLTLCIKTGNFPLYAHQMAMADFMRPDFKYGTFKDMLRHLITMGISENWHTLPGFADCKAALAFLCKPADLSSPVHKHITPQMLTFFKETFAPFLMANFAYEIRTLPKLLGAIQKIEAILDKPKEMTLKFNELKLAPPPIQMAAKEAAPTQPKSKDEPSTGFKKEFLNKS